MSANTKPSLKKLFGGLFGSAKKNAPNVASLSEGNTSRNYAIAAALQEEEINKAAFLPTWLSGKSKDQKNAELKAAFKAIDVAKAKKAMEKAKKEFAAVDARRKEGKATLWEHDQADKHMWMAEEAYEKAKEASNASVNIKPANGNAAKRARTRKQRGGALRVPGPRNVLRVTGKTVRKLRNVGVYGLKKVGNGVHMVTGLLGSVLRKGGKTLKSITKRRQQTRKQ